MSIQDEHVTPNQDMNVQSLREGEQIRRRILEDEYSIERMQYKKDYSEIDIILDVNNSQIINHQANNPELNSDVQNKSLVNQNQPINLDKVNEVIDEILDKKKNNKNEKEVSIYINNSEKKINQCNMQFNDDQEIKKSTDQNKWKSFALSILYYIGRFIARMKQYSQKYKFKYINKRQFQLIGDVSSDFSYYQKNRFIHQNQYNYYCNYFQTTYLEILSIVKIINSPLLKSFNTQIKKYLFSTLDPDSLFKQIWNLFILLYLITDIYYITLDYSFFQYYNVNFDNQGIVHYFFYHLPIFICSFDIYLNFLTAFYRNGVLIRNKQAICLHYLKSQFWLDAVTILFLEIADQYNNPNYTLIQILRIQQIRRLLQQLEDIICLQDLMAAIFELFKLVALVLFIGHFCACAFFLLHRLEKATSELQQTWIDSYSITDKPIDAYIASYYWACITMVTVGYGDIVPTNTIERGFVVVITLISCGVFAYTVNSIGMIITNLAQKNVKFKQKMNHLTRFMKQRGLKIDLQMKVKKYFQYLHDESDNEDQQVHQMIMKDLASELKNQVLTDIYGRIIRSKKLFYLNFSDRFLSRLALKMTEQKFGPEDIIYKETDLVNCIFFIINGDITLSVNIKRNVSVNGSNNCGELLQIRSLTKGDIFGEIEFFSEKPALYSAISQNVVTAALITRKDFYDVMKEFPEDYQKFCMMRDSLNLYSNSRGMAVKCNSCDQYTHLFNKCPIIQFNGFKEQVIRRFNQMDKEQQQRQKLERIDNRLQHSWNHVEILKDTAIQYLINNYDNDDIEQLKQVIENINQVHKQQGPQQKVTQQTANTSQQINQLNQQQSNLTDLSDDQNKIKQDPCYSTRNQNRRKSLLRNPVKRLSLIQPQLLEELIQPIHSTNQNNRPTDQEKNQQQQQSTQQVQSLQLIQENIQQEDSKTIKSGISGDGGGLDNTVNRIQEKRQTLIYIDEQADQQSKKSLYSESLKSFQQFENIQNNNIINNFESTSKTLVRQASLESINHIHQQENLKVGSKKSLHDLDNTYQSVNCSIYSGKLSDNQLKKAGQDSSKNNSKNQSSQKSFQSILNFDSLKDWKCYFPYNNISSIILSINSQQHIKTVAQSKKLQFLQELHTKLNQSKSQKKLENRNIYKKSINQHKQSSYQDQDQIIQMVESK